MAARKTDEHDDRFYAINAMGTTVLVDAADFKARFEPAGYRKLKADEQAPPQAHEVAALGTDDREAILSARLKLHGHARHPLPPVEESAPA